MAVNPLELRPKTAPALFDAASRLCATSTGVWALTLPSSIALVTAAFPLLEAISRKRPLLWPVIGWTCAWLFRGICQGAACHHVEHQVLGRTPASLRASVRAAAMRAPALCIAAGWQTVLNAALWIFTLGLGFFVLGAHMVAHAAVMRGEGGLLNFYGMCAKLLGPARSLTPWTKLFGFTQLIMAINLHFATQLALLACNKLLGFDFTFAMRLTSIDNPVWLAAIATVTFALFEPMRATTASLLLIDGRVRREGVDLLAQLRAFRNERP